MRLPPTDALLFRTYLLSTMAMLAVTSLWAATGDSTLGGALAGAWYATAGLGVTFTLWLAIGHLRNPDRDSIWLAVRESSE